jgi:hypothetical protein
MFFNRYILFVILAFLSGVTSLYIVMTRLHPVLTPALALALFFVSLFLASSAFFVIVSYYIRVTLYRYELFLNHFNVSLRQGLILGFAVCALTGLQILRTLNWWNALILLLLSLLLELYFVARE